MKEGSRSSGDSGLHIRLFDAQRTDQQLSFDQALEVKPSKRQLLWIDIEGELDHGQQQRLVERFPYVRDAGAELADAKRLPKVALHRDHFDLRVAAEPDPQEPRKSVWLDVAAGENVVVTQHAEPLKLVGSMDEAIALDARVGDLDAPEFVASLLDAVVTSYHAAVDGLEDELDELDTQALRGRPTSASFGQLVAIRRRIAHLRRLIAAHRAVFAVVGGRDFGRGIQALDPEVFMPVSGRFEAALLSIESTREVVLGSFDILMTRASQRTNDVVRTLTLVTVMAVPATVTAGFLGMNVIVPISNDDPASFWIIVAFIIVLEASILALARWRGWIGDGAG